MINSVPQVPVPPLPMRVQLEESNPPRIAVILKTPGITIGLGAGAHAFGAMFKKTMLRALHDKGVLDNGQADAWGNQAIGIFRVTHLHAGLVAVRQELESLRILPRSQISWLDYAEDVFRVCHPAGERDSVAITHQSLAAEDLGVQSARQSTFSK